MRVWKKRSRDMHRNAQETPSREEPLTTLASSSNKGFFRDRSLSYIK
jgi:hypothetical protein